MTHFISISVFLSIMVYSTLGELSCGVNERVVDCPKDCAYDYCPKDELQDNQPCKKSEICPPPACKCIFNHRRAQNGTCIPSYQCPAFSCSRDNEEYDACPPLCPTDDCHDAPLQGVCPFFLLFVIECRPTCRCTENHYRSYGVCVPYQDCPNIRDKINQNETIPQVN